MIWEKLRIENPRRVRNPNISRIWPLPMLAAPARAYARGPLFKIQCAIGTDCGTLVGDPGVPMNLGKILRRVSEAASVSRNAAPS